MPMGNIYTELTDNLEDKLFLQEVIKGDADLFLLDTILRETFQKNQLS